jgi:hypothetical protein
MDYHVKKLLTKGTYYVQMLDETVEEAIEGHVFIEQTLRGHSTIEAAVSEGEFLDVEAKKGFNVLDYELKVVKTVTHG